ncbi:MAG: nucleotide exchange factor GrpE [Balneolaceae bacterium]|nr:nucleotide exchange factor GrpE [Balneolaceae bacterium]
MSESSKEQEQQQRDSEKVSATADGQGGAQGGQQQASGDRQAGQPQSREGGEGETPSGFIGPDISTYQEIDRKELVAALAERDRYIQEMEQEVGSLKESNLRKTAEMDNFRKRVQRDRAQIYETAKANALEDFLSVNDDLRRTLKAAEDLDVPDTLMDGVNLVAEKFEEVLRKHGVERIDEEMVPFDVDIHDAMMRRKPEGDDVDSDMVLQVIENGYRIGERTIRHAKVIVSE